MIHKAFCSVLATGALLLVGPAAHAATFELIDNGTTYDAMVTQEAGDPMIFAVDMFIQASQGATLTVANNIGNPFDQATGNDSPPGNPDAILIGGSDISGTCDNSANSCFGDFSCGGGTCVFGRNGAIKLGEVNWDGNGTVSLRNNSQAVDGSLNEIPHTNVSGCQLINGEEVLAGEATAGMWIGQLLQLHVRALHLPALVLRLVVHHADGLRTRPPARYACGQGGRNHRPK